MNENGQYVVGNVKGTMKNSFYVSDILYVESTVGPAV